MERILDFEGRTIGRQTLLACERRCSRGEACPGLAELWGLPTSPAGLALTLLHSVMQASGASLSKI